MNYVIELSSDSQKYLRKIDKPSRLRILDISNSLARIQEILGWTSRSSKEKTVFID